MGNLDVDKAMQTLVEHGFIDKDGHPINIRSDAISRHAAMETCNNKQVLSKLDASDDAISRKSIKQKLQEHHDFFVNAYGGFSNLPQNDKSRVDEINACIAMVVNEPPVTPKHRTGHWIECEEEVKCFCSECKEISDYPTKFCPHCGAKMVKPQESEEISREEIAALLARGSKEMTREPCEDAISRQAAIDAFSMFAEYESNRTNAEWVNRTRVVLSSLPPVQPIRPSVIEDIKAEIKQKREENRNGEYDKIFELCLLIIDNHTSGKEQT